MPDFLGVATLSLTTLAWYGTGFGISRYIFRQHQWLTVLPASLGTGLIVHLFLLNGLLYALDSQISYWLSLLIMGLSMIAMARWHGDVPPLAWGMPRSHRFWVIGGVLFLWMLIVIGLIRHTYFDLYFHYSIAGLIAKDGLPLRYPYNPDYCSVYHYGSDMLIGVLFRVAGLNMERAAEWVIAWSSLSILGMVAALGYRISQQRPVAVALVGLALFVFGGGATWLAEPFQNEDVTQITTDMPVFDYLKNRPEMRERPPIRAGTPFTDEFFNYPYITHLYNTLYNPPLICVLLVMLVLLDIVLAERSSWLAWLLVGIISATAALSAETILTLPAGLMGFYLLHALWQRRSLWQTTLTNFTIFAIPFGLLVVFQGGVITDTLFCAENELTAPGEPVQSLSLLHTPGYYSFLSHPDSVRIDLTDLNNWGRWLSEWGFLFFLLPFVGYHCWRRNPHPLGRMFLLTALITIGTTLTATYSDGYELGRIIYIPLYICGIFAADWLVWLWTRRWWWRPVAVLLFIAVTLSGLMAIREMVYAKERQIAFPMAALDVELQQAWFGQIGDRADVIFDPQQVGFTNNFIPALFGNYTLAVPSRSNRHNVLASIVWLNQYPAPELLRYNGIEYLYIREQWWQNTSTANRALIQAFDPVFWREEDGLVRGMVAVPDGEAAYPAWFDLIDQPAYRETFSQENVYLVYRDWAALIGEQQVFYPRDQRTVPMENILTNLITPETVEPALYEQWNTTGLPGYLAEIGAEYVLVNPWQWGLYFNNEIRNQLNNPAYFEEVRRWQVGAERFYVLYRPVSTATLADFQQVTPLPGNPVIYYPDIRSNIERQQALLGGYIAATGDTEFVEVANWLGQARLQEDFTAEQQAALGQWRQALFPGFLKDAGVDYLVITSLWWGFNLNEAQYNMLMNPVYYRLVQRSEFDAWDGSFRYGYVVLEVVGDQRE